MMTMRKKAALAAFFLAAGAPPSAAVAGDELHELRREIEALRSEYDARLSALERRLAALEGHTEETTTEDPAIEDLRARARRAAGVAEAPPSRSPGAAAGRERNLNRLNPEISFTGIVSGNASDSGRESFEVDEFELDLQSALDPFSRTRLTIAFREGEVELEEAYINYSGLPGGLELLGGKIRQRFGALNRQHRHALPQTTYPLAYQSYFGEEGLAQTGLSFSWLLPKLWATTNELTVEVTDGENETAFAGESFDSLAVLAHWKNFWQLSDSTYFEWGLSGVGGNDASDAPSRVWGTDLTLNWTPPGRAKYREITWRTELLMAERDDPLGGSREALGGFSYLEGLFRRNLWAGVRFDSAEDPFEPEVRRWGVSPYLTWWQSEYVRLRGEYGYLKNDRTKEEENRFTLQLTWAAGPHKHETY